MQDTHNLLWLCSSRNPKRLCRLGSPSFLWAVALVVMFILYNGPFVMSCMAPFGLVTCSTPHCDEACALPPSAPVLVNCYMIPPLIYTVAVFILFGVAVLCIVIGAAVLELKDDVVEAMSYVPPPPLQAP